jgi:membrane protease YdiL (CAAX protease family)
VGKVQLSGGEKRALILWVLAGIVGLWYAQRHFFEAFPEASVNFQVTREEALGRAKSFVESVGQDVSSYRLVIVFGVDDNAKTYLERQVGLKEANRLMSSEVHVWSWNVRFFKPQQEEEFRVGVSPEGNITGYAHKIPEAQAGAQPSREAAQEIAQKFLVERLGKSAAAWDFLPEEASSDKKPNRLDWSFTWEKHGFKAKDAPERLKIELNGNQIGSAREALKVPEQWERDYERLRSGNTALNIVAVIPYLLLFGSVIWLGIQFTRSNQTSWRLALRLGVLVTVFMAAMQLNQWPLDLSHYDTNAAFGSFAIKRFMWALLVGVSSALTVTLVLPGGEPLYRAAKPQFLRLKNAFTLRGLRTKEFFSSTIVGFSLAAAHMGVLVAFYLVANKFGAWAPQEINYEDSVSTAIPWIGGIAIGLLASTSEEFLFRLFAIPYLQNLTKSRVLAVVLAAFSWGFLHTTYPNEPPYIRGLEVGLIGIVAGFVMLRWGILATLIWHYTVDATLVGLLLIRSHSLYLRASGIVIGLAVLIPFGFAVFWRIQRGTFEDDADLLNAAPDKVEAVSEPEIAEEKIAAPTGALTNGLLALLTVGILAGGIGMWKLKPQHLGDYLKVSVSAKEAKMRAEDVLKKRGIKANLYESATNFVDATDAIANQYLREKIGIPALNDIYKKRVPGAVWHVRFFRDGEAEEYAVDLLPDGSLQSVNHKLAEAAKGASLTKEEALARAAAFLKDVKHLDISQWTLVDSSSEKKPNRVDHNLTWQENSPLDRPGTTTAADTTNHAFARVQVAVVGDEVNNFHTFVKIPDDWRRKQDEETISETLLLVFKSCFYAALVIAVLVQFLKRIKSAAMKEIPWRTLAGWGGWAAAAFAAGFVFSDSIPKALDRYPTSIPLKVMFGEMGVSFLLLSAGTLGVVGMLFAVGWFFCRQAFGETELPGWRGMPGSYYRDAVMIGLGGTGALLALSRVTEWFSVHWPTKHRALGAAFGFDFDSFVPGIAIPAGAVLHGLVFSGLIAVIGGFVLAHCKSPAVRAALFALGSLAMVGDWGSPADFAKQWIARAVFLAVVVFGVTKVVRLNLLGYFLVLAIPGLLLGAVELLSQPNAFYHQQGAICLGVLAVLLIWPLTGWLTAKNTSGEAEPAAQAR